MRRQGGGVLSIAVEFAPERRKYTEMKALRAALLRMKNKRDAVSGPKSSIDCAPERPRFVLLYRAGRPGAA